MKRAALYCRVSTEEQARHGYSIGAQLEALRRYAKEQGYVIVGEYLDEGISGQKGYKKRPAMTELMQALDRVDVILFIRLDRWFRSVKLFYQVQDLLDAHGVDALHHLGLNRVNDQIAILILVVAEEPVSAYLHLALLVTVLKPKTDVLGKALAFLLRK